MAGNDEALARGMKVCEDVLARDPKNAEALIWHGSGTMFQSGKLFQAGDIAKGQELWQKGMKEMDDAVEIAPDRVSVRIPRGAVLLSVSRFLPGPEMARPLLEKAVGDYEHTLELQKQVFDTLGAHPRGELLLGLADGHARLGDEDKARAYFERIQAMLPGTVYANSAAKWIQTKALAPREAGCLGCHVGK
jgi:tetratricopeptide (TPR) repeat protein